MTSHAAPDPHDSSPTPTAALLRRARDTGAPGHRSADDRALLLRYRERRDPELRDALVQRFLPLARSIARRHRRPSEPYEDILQVACMALVKAIDRFDPDVGVEFSSYAVPSIVGEIKRHYRDHTWAVHVPRDVKELALRTERVSEDLRRELRRAPSVGELAARLGVPVEQVVAGRAAAQAYRPDSLNAVRTTDDGEELLAQSIGVRDPGFSRAEDREVLDGLIRHLTDRERVVLELRFAVGLTQREIAERVGLSQMSVSRILRRAMARLQRVALD